MVKIWANYRASHHCTSLRHAMMWCLTLFSFHPPHFIIVRFTSPTIGKATKFMTFIFYVSFSQWRLSCQVFASVIKLWVALESTIVLLVGFWLINVSTYIRPRSTNPLVSSTFFWRDDKNFKAPILELSPSFIWPTSPSIWLDLSSEFEAKKAWKALKTIQFGYFLVKCGPLHMKKLRGRLKKFWL